MDNSSPEPLVLHVLVRKIDEGVEVHCLEIDHVTAADTQEQALDDICSLIRSQFLVARQHKDLDNLFFPAPAEYWRMLARAKPIGSRLIDLTGDGDESTLPPVPAATNGIRLQEFAVAS